MSAFALPAVSRHFHRFAWLAVALTLCVVVFGSFVRLSDAGLSCPDWPTCYGRAAWPQAAHEVNDHVASAIRPFENHKAWREQVHRHLAATLGLLVLLLAVLGIAVLVAPQGSVPVTSGDYIANPGIKGLLEGYNTMDTFGALMFGMLIIDVLKQKGISEVRLQTRYLAWAGIIAAAGLCLVYISLFELGATSGGLLANPANGGEIVALYVAKLFGPAGQLVLAGIVSLACLTTAVGLTSACADFFHTLLPRLSYRAVVIAMCVTCTLVANVGLATLITLSVPVLVLIYPVAVALVVMTFLQERFARQAFAMRAVLLVAGLFGAIDALKATGISVSALDFLPLFSQGLAWLLPTLLTMVFCACLPARDDEACCAVQES